MIGKDKACECGHNLWKTIKKKKVWKCRGCGYVRDAALEREMQEMKNQRANSQNITSRLKKVFSPA